MTMRPTFIEGIDTTDVLPTMLYALLEDGEDQPSRNGGTKEIGNAVVHVKNSRSPYVTTPLRNANLAAQIAETVWVLSGRNDVAFLQHYLPRAPQFSDDGETWRGGYGPRLRAWLKGDRAHGSAKPGDVDTIDQLQHVVDLLRADQDTRRAVMAIYDPAVDATDGKDIPCNNWLHFIARRGTLHLHVATRSNDAMWGWSGINAFEWTVLLQVVANLTGLYHGSVTYSVTSLHLYERHYAKAQRIVDHQRSNARKDMSCAPDFCLPAGVRTVGAMDELLQRWLHLEGRIRTDSLTQEDRDAIGSFPEPMLRSWLHVLHAYWGLDDGKFSRYYQGTDLLAAYMATPVNPEGRARQVARGAGKAVQAQYKHPGLDRPKPEWMPFLQYVTELHAEKDAAYGDSWKRRGEQMAIMANIARKVDRLGVTDNHDTAADTAIDLLVYLVKYRLWLVDHAGAGTPQGLAVEDQDILPQQLSDGTKYVERYLQVLDQQREPTVAGVKELEETLQHHFDANLTKEVEMQWRYRDATVELMIRLAWELATRLYHQQGNATRMWNPEA